MLFGTIMRIQTDNQRPNQDIQFLVPLSARRPAAQDEGGGDWILMLPVGRWVSHHFWHVQGIYEISSANVAEMETNFRRKLPPIDIAGNVQHDFGSASVGWAEDVRATPAGLEVRVQWTPLGQRLLADDAFRYVSPEWWDLGRPYVIAESGESIPWVFDGFGLTNTPFFTGLPGLIAESRPDGILICAPLTAVWEETDNQIRHRLRPPEDFRPDTLRTKNLAASAVRKVDVSFTISDAMANGVSMILGKLLEAKVPEGNDANSMVLQSMRFTRQTDTQDGWTTAQAKQWFTKSTFSTGAAPMPEPIVAQVDPAVTPQPNPLEAEAARLRAENERLTSEAAKIKREQDLAALQVRFAAARLPGNRTLAPAHAERLASTAIDLPADAREAHVVATIAALEQGQVETGERGGVSPAHIGAEGISPLLVATARRLGLDPAYAYAAANRGPGGALDVAGSRIAVGRIAPLSASVEIPSLSYQETMILIEGFFVAGYETTPALTSQFANRVVSDQRTISYRALGAPPRMREWLDEIQGAVFNTRSAFPVTVRDWEATVEIPLSELQADKLGQYAMAIQQMGGLAKQHPDELLAALLAASEATLCYDGQNFCDTDHSEGDSGTQSNFLTTGYDDDDAADVIASLGAAVSAFNKFKDDRGSYLRIGSRPDAVFDVVVRPEVLGLFRTLANADVISGTTNVLKGRIRPMALPELTVTSDWYVLYTEGPVKPFIVQYQNEPSALKALGPDSEYAKMRGRAWFSTQGNYTVAPGDWRYIIKLQKA